MNSDRKEQGFPQTISREYRQAENFYASSTSPAIMPAQVSSPSSPLSRVIW